MSRCQHNQKIVKFCISPACNHINSGGCQYCFKRYHFHLGQSKFIKENQINDIIKSLTIYEQKKPKIRPLKQSIYNYFNIIKSQLSTYIDCLSSDILNKITYSYLIKQQKFNSFKKLKLKEYNKITTEEIINLLTFKKENQNQQGFKEKQLNEYFKQTKEAYEKINKINSLYKEFQKQTQNSYMGQTIMSVGIFYKKITDIYEFINNQSKKKEEYFQHIINNKLKKSFNQLQEKQFNKLTKNNQNIKQAYNKQQNSSSSQSDQKVKEMILSKSNKSYENQTFEEQQPRKKQINKIKGKQVNFCDLVASQIVQKSSIIRPRKVSIDSRCGYLLGKSKLKTFQQKQKQIEERKKKLEEIMNASQKKKQPQNAQSSGQGSSQLKNQQGYYSQNQNKISNISVRSKIQNGQNMIAHTLLPAGKQDKKLYEQQQNVEKKTLKIPVNVIQQHQDQECQSPILRLKKSEKSKPQTGSSGFGLFKVHQVSTSQQAHSQPIPQQTKQTTQKQMSSSGSEFSDKQNIRPTIPQKKISQMNLSQNETNSLYLLIQSLKLSGKKAIPLLQACLKYSPFNFSAVQYLSFLLLEQNKPKQCLNVCNQALKLIIGQPNNVQVSFHLFNNKAAALNQLGRFSESIPILQKCLQVTKKDILYKNMGDAYFNLGIIEKAVINYENCIILNDQNHQALYNLAVCLYIQRNFQEAKLKIQRALMIDRKNNYYLQLLKQIGISLKNA